MPRIGIRRPSEDDRVPPPQAAASGWRWWALTMAVLGSRRVSARRYHWMVQSMVSTAMPVSSSMRVEPKLQANERMAAYRLRRCSSSGRRGLAPPAWVRWVVNPVSRSISEQLGQRHHREPGHDRFPRPSRPGRRPRRSAG